MRCFRGVAPSGRASSNPCSLGKALRTCTSGTRFPSTNPTQSGNGLRAEDSLTHGHPPESSQPLQPGALHR